VKVVWETLRFTATTPDGYADTSMRPIEDLVQAAVDARSKEHKPVVVWICDAEDDRGNDQLEKKIFYDEKVGLAMKRFICLRGDIQALPNEQEAEKLYRQAPLFYFFDPAGKEFTKPLYGKRASSRSGFCKVLEKLWDKSFELSLKDYSKQMSDILDELDKLEGQKTRLTDQIDRAADNPRKLAQLKKEEEELQAAEAEINAKEKQIVDGVAVRAEFLPSGGGENAQK
jgi:hypothetical protein